MISRHFAFCYAAEHGVRIQLILGDYMSTTEALARFTLKLLESERLWDTYCDKYLFSYRKAYCRYAETVNLQADSNKQDAQDRADLCMLVLSLCGGSAFSVFFGSTAMKLAAANIVRNKAMNAFIHREWNNAFNTLAWMDNSKTAKFVMGQIWDKGEKIVSTDLKQSLEKMTATVGFSGGDLRISPNEVTLNVAKLNMNMKGMLNNWTNAVSQAGIFAYDHHGGNNGIEKLYQSSPFFTPPKIININNLAKNIELVLWLQFILNQDYIHEYINYLEEPKKDSMGFEEIGSVRRVKKETISKNSHNVNPHSREYHTSEIVGPFNRSIEYNEIGDIIKKRINKLHMYRFRSFMFSNNFGSPSKNSSHETLKYAEVSLRLMGQANSNLIRSNINRN